MKTVIRCNVFETNSSSQHSICVTKNNTHVTKEEINDRESPEYVCTGKDDVWWLWGIDGGYGRSPFQILSTFEDKFKYAMCEFLGRKYADEPEYDELMTEFHQIAYDVAGASTLDIRQREEKVYLDKDGNELSRKEIKYDHYDADKREYIFIYTDSDGNEQEAQLADYVYDVSDIGQIDHQSAGILTNFLKDTGISLKEFLTNKRFLIVVDGDEYNEWDNIKYSGIFNFDNVVAEYNDHRAEDDPEWMNWLEEQACKE